MPILANRRVAAALVFVFSTVAARADVKYPTADDVRGFESLCAGGNTHVDSVHVDAAIQAWRLKPSVDGNLNHVEQDLGAVMQKIKQGNDAPLYLAYVDCVKDLVLAYLNHANSAPDHATKQPAKP